MGQKKNKACTDEIINLEHDDSQTKDAETQAQDHDANLPEVVVDFEDMGNNEDNQTGARSKLWGVVRGGGDNSIQFINFGRVGDKSFEEWRQKIRGWKGG